MLPNIVELSAQVAALGLKALGRDDA